jgi:uncharacterized protein
MVRHFFCTLRPPRSTFPADITAEEAALMQAHADYWREWLNEGYVVVTGPVADPKGTYGILVLQLPDDKSPESLVNEDPVCKADRGFRFDIYPMRAMLPEQR